jgi:hypothetical protein
MEIGEMASLFLEICVLKISKAWLAWLMNINEMASLCLSVENKGALAIAWMMKVSEMASLFFEKK